MFMENRSNMRIYEISEVKMNLPEFISRPYLVV